MDALVAPGTVAGESEAPSSKSETHRALLTTALAGGGTVADPLVSRDTKATALAIDALGGGVTWGDTDATVTGFSAEGPTPAAAPVDCGNSGTTLRLVTGVAALAAGQTRLTGDASLCRRPNGPLLDALADLGAGTSSDAGDGTAPLTVTGPLEGGSTSMPGSVSSQFVSSVLLVGALTERGVEVELTSPLASAPYLELTIDLLAIFGVGIDRRTDGFAVAGGQTLDAPASGVVVGPDPTAASYPLAAGAIAGDPSVTVIDAGDRAGEPAPIIDVLEAFDLPVSTDGPAVTVERATPTPATIDLGDRPDLLPTAAVIAALGDGTSHLVNCGHARHKETDRVRVTAQLLRELGVPVTAQEDGLIVRGRPDGLGSGTIDPHGDHRIAMAAAVAALAADGPVRIHDASCVDVSDPDFFDRLARLGAEVTFDPAR